MAQLMLQLMQRHAGFQLMGRIGVAQAVNTADLVDSGASLGLGKQLLRTGNAERRVWIGTGKQLLPWAQVLPIGSQESQ